VALFESDCWCAKARVAEVLVLALSDRLLLCVNELLFEAFTDSEVA